MNKVSALAVCTPALAWDEGQPVIAPCLPALAREQDVYAATPTLTGFLEAVKYPPTPQAALSCSRKRCVCLHRLHKRKGERCERDVCGHLPRWRQPYVITLLYRCFKVLK